MSDLLRLYCMQALLTTDATPSAAVERLQSAATPISPSDVRHLPPSLSQCSTSAEQPCETGNIFLPQMIKFGGDSTSGLTITG